MREMDTNKYARYDVWNPMVKLINEHPDGKVKVHAKMILWQYNTGSGIKIKDELESFLRRHGY